MSQIEFKNVTKSYDAFKALDSINLSVDKGEFVFIVGHSGAGKSTLIELLIREERPTSGEIYFDGNDLGEIPYTELSLLRRKIGVVFQDFRLLESRNVYENVAIALEVVETSEQDIKEVVPNVLNMVGLADKVDVNPKHLSGGEKRRLQLTRLLMDSPNVLLLDEPTNDFDIEILTELEDLLDSFAGTLIVISHDRYFLERTCDRIVGLLGDGKLTDLPRGIDQYLELRERQIKDSLPKESESKRISNAAEERQLKKDLVRIERQMEKLDLEILELKKAQEAVAFNPDELIKATNSLSEAESKRAALEEEWLNISVQLEG